MAAPTPPVPNFNAPGTYRGVLTLVHRRCGVLARMLDKPELTTSPEEEEALGAYLRLVVRDLAQRTRQEHVGVTERTPASSSVTDGAPGAVAYQAFELDVDYPDVLVPATVAGVLAYWFRERAERALEGAASEEYERLLKAASSPAFTGFVRGRSSFA
jgi:hypothetical protein